MNLLQQLQIRGQRFGQQVVRLATNQVLGARSGGQPSGAIDRRRRGCVPQKDFEGQRYQGIAGQNRRCLVELDVTCRLTAPQVVVVHRRKIVMDQRVGMDHLDSACRRDRRVHVTTAQMVGRQHQQRPHPLAWRKEAVPDCIPQSLGTVPTAQSVVPAFQPRVFAQSLIDAVSRRRHFRRKQRHIKRGIFRVFWGHRHAFHLEKNRTA